MIAGHCCKCATLLDLILLDEILQLRPIRDFYFSLYVPFYAPQRRRFIKLSTADGRRLKAIIKDCNAAQKHVWRAEIILFSAEGIGTNEIMRRTSTSRTCVWRWQERFMQEGVDGLLCDKTRPYRVPPLGDEVTGRIVALTLENPPTEVTHWTGAMMAKAVAVLVSSVQRIWRSHGLQRHQLSQFKLSNGPDFVAKLRDVVGLYVDPPAHACYCSQH